MVHDVLPEHEVNRLNELSKYQIMDTPEDVEFDDIVKLAAQICGKPISLISLLDQDRQWFKARIGNIARQTPREIAFCHHAIEQESILLVKDALLDNRFNKNPLVLHEPNIRFYAGVPLVNPNGYKLGTLCVLDNKPGNLDAEQKFALRVLAQQVVKSIEIRYQQQQLKKSADTLAKINAKIKADQDILNKTQIAARIGWFSFSFEENQWHCSQGLADLLAISPKKTVSYNEFTFFILPEDQPLFRNAIRNVIPSHPSFDVHFRWIISGRDKPLNLRCRGEVVFNAQGEALKMIGVTQDISEIDQAQKALEESESRWKFALEGAGEGVWDWDSEYGTLFLSPQWKGLLGYKINEIDSSVEGWQNLIHPDDLSDVKNLWEQLKDGQIEFINHKHRLRNKQGEYCWVLVRGKVIGDVLSGKFRIIGTIADISDQLAITHRLKQHNQHLKELNSEMDHFVYRVSHDLRAPIARLKGLLQLIKQNPKDAMIENYIKFAEDCLTKQDGYIKDILDYSRNSHKALEITEIDFKSFIQETVHEYEMESQRRNITFITDVAQKASFFSDVRRLKIILNNLLSNALRYQLKEDGRVELKVYACLQKVTIIVSDNGIGIDKKHLPYLGQMFYRATDRKPGAGLGLYILSQSLKQLHGEMQIYSRLGKGTRVEIKIPTLPDSF